MSEQNIVEGAEVLVDDSVDTIDEIVTDELHNGSSFTTEEFVTNSTEPSDEVIDEVLAEELGVEEDFTV